MDADGELGRPAARSGRAVRAGPRPGARIHNNSWGALADGAYRTTSLEVDAYVHEHPDMLVVVAAGNHGTAFKPRNAQPGFVDLFSIDAPGTAKNALTVGASRSDRPRNPAADLEGFDRAGSPTHRSPTDWSAATPPGWPLLGARPLRGTGTHQARPGRPGTFILSTRASTAPEESFWAVEDDRYAYMGGTSMATPLVSGCAAVVRQYSSRSAITSPAPRC